MKLSKCTFKRTFLLLIVGCVFRLVILLVMLFFILGSVGFRLCICMVKMLLIGVCICFGRKLVVGILIVCFSFLLCIMCFDIKNGWYSIIVVELKLFCFRYFCIWVLFILLSCYLKVCVFFMVNLCFLFLFCKKWKLLVWLFLKWKLLLIMRCFIFSLVIRILL